MVRSGSLVVVLYQRFYSCSCVRHWPSMQRNWDRAAHMPCLRRARLRLARCSTGAGPVGLVLHPMARRGHCREALCGAQLQMPRPPCRGRLSSPRWRRRLGSLEMPLLPGRPPPTPQTPPDIPPPHLCVLLCLGSTAVSPMHLKLRSPVGPFYNSDIAAMLGGGDAGQECVCRSDSA